MRAANHFHTHAKPWASHPCELPRTLPGPHTAPYNNGLSQMSPSLTSPPIAAPSPPTERSLQIALAAARAAEDNNAKDIVLLDMRKITPVFDYFVIATGNSRRQLHAISDEIEHVLKEQLKDKRMGLEGYNESKWILLDYGNVVVHMFDEETRDFYQLEDFWSEAERVPLPWAKDEAPTEGEASAG
jgi:ribosome-associated protein